MSAWVAGLLIAAIVCSPATGRRREVSSEALDSLQALGVQEVHIVPADLAPYGEVLAPALDHRDADRQNV